MVLLLVTSNCIKKYPAKTKNIKNTKGPSNVQELPITFGLLMYVSKIIEKRCEVCFEQRTTETFNILRK